MEKINVLLKKIIQFMSIEKIIRATIVNEQKELISNDDLNFFDKIYEDLFSFLNTYCFRMFQKGFEIKTFHLS